jgi:hypothetical protein
MYDSVRLEHVESAFEHLQQIYAVAGVPENCQLHVGEGGHRYYKAGAWPFIRKHFETPITETV